MRLMVKSRSISVWRKVGNRKRFSTYLLWRKKYILIAKKMMADPASFNKMILLILLIKGKEKLRSYILANISYRKKKISPTRSRADGRYENIGGQSVMQILLNRDSNRIFWWNRFLLKLSQNRGGGCPFAPHVSASPSKQVQVYNFFLGQLKDTLMLPFILQYCKIRGVP